ncbi:fungal specific transcription factor domain-containing protein [Histoplasma capsulatum]|uniref:C6 finger domain transcription factor nscR n=1 Tax=Ajellomyces capsulatus TaxID=5037 RepID=A0A8A1MP21_AJECA|nr:fungal specific transcription factor domain-containing protein [Histoplasma capsulatum]
MQQERKRRIQACYPCYTRKQKCNRQYPCNHCSRRRRAEGCIYSGGTAPGREARVQKLPQGASHSKTVPTRYEHEHGSNGSSSSRHSALAKSFGYFEDSNSNTMALLRNLELPDEDETELIDPSSRSIWGTIQHEVGRMPDRQIVDFLVQYFVSELNCSCRRRRTHIVDQIYGRSLEDIRDTCCDIGENLAKACNMLDGKGSLFRVQHLLFAALKLSCEGGTASFWEGVASASRAAQKAGIHREATDCRRSPPLLQENGAQELEKEVRRRTFCSLYALDSHLARQLDRIPFLPDNSVVEILPRLRLIADIGDSPSNIDGSAPNIFTERLMEVQLALFCRSLNLKQNSKYDPTESEHRYERLCAEYLPSIHAAFAIDKPDMTWDEALPKLPMQRQLFYISIFDSVCWNFRPLLLLKPNDVASLPPYKRVLLQSQKLRLGLAALKELEAVTALHLMFGGSYTRFGAIIFNTFEAAVLLLCLCTHADFPFDQGDENTDILGMKVKLSRKRAMQVAELAINRLQMLAEFSDMAASGARVATQLFARAFWVKQPANPNPDSRAVSDTPSLWAPLDSGTMESIDDDIQEQWQSLGQKDFVLTPEMFLSMVQQNTSSPNGQEAPIDIPLLWGNFGL